MKENAQGSRKRVVTVGLVVCAVIVVLSLLTASLDPDQLVKSWFGRGEAEETPFDFYPIDDYLSARTRDEYAQLDSRVHISDPSTGATYSLEEEDLASAEPYARFFYDYFEAVIAGDNESYATYFSDDYLAAVALPEDFTPQRIYDIRVTPYQEDAVRGSAYLVDYKILRNNGTFRTDVGSNASRTLVIYLVETDGTLHINEILPYTQY